MHLRRQFGDKAEEIASRYLCDKGYVILERNFQKPWGEIDIIAKSGNVTVFVEVKANAKDTDIAFSPEVRANSKKMRKVVRTAMLYLGTTSDGLSGEWRIDVISVTISASKAKIIHFKNVTEAPF